ncbi:MAG: hypothetical protein M0R77_21285 [Gammaproteobacteria bacterium]|jgi:hypothetical protein|nr:hypothetical protein [Gammaproteobacteria bacterium]MDY0101074.1 hypothetical protein [Bacilli bacterium]
MQIKKVLFVTLFAASLLVSCNPNDTGVLTKADVLEKASNFGALLINGTNGIAYADRNQTIKLSGRQYLIGARILTLENILLEKDGEETDVEVTVSFSVDKNSSSLWKITEQKPDEYHVRLTPTYPKKNEEDYHSIITATLKLMDDEELQVSWNVVLRAPKA